MYWVLIEKDHHVLSNSFVEQEESTVNLIKLFDSQQSPIH